MQIKANNENFHIFGYITPSGYVSSKMVPVEIAKTYGKKDGISHFSIFDNIFVGTEIIWVYNGNKIIWNSSPDEELKYSVKKHLEKKYNIHTTHDSHQTNYYAKAEKNINFIKKSQHIKQSDYPSINDISAYVESLKLYLLQGQVKDEQLIQLIKNLPDPSVIRARLSKEESKILFHTIGFIWKEITGRNIIEDSKIVSKKESLCGNYWLINKGILLEGPNHYSIIKRNLELFRILLGINAFALHEKMALPPEELIKLVLDHGGIRIFASPDKRIYFQLTDETYGKWGGKKIRRYDFAEKKVKIIDKTKPYKGWGSGIYVIL
jgi:hypothetical protein